MASAWRWIPRALICMIHAVRSERRTKPMTFEILLLNFLHARGSTKSLHSAQEEYWCSLQHDLTLHHVAFSFSRHPGQRSFRYERHAPQYSPQWATKSVLGIMSFMVSSFRIVWSTRISYYSYYFFQLLSYITIGNHLPLVKIPASETRRPTSHIDVYY